MILTARFILLGFLSLMLITQYQNCSSASENTMFESSNLSSTSGVSDPGRPSIQVSTLVSPLKADSYDNQISVSGSCNTAGRKYNYIQYSVVESVAKRKLNLSTGPSPVYYLRDAICENGKFYLIIPIANEDQEGPNPAISTYLLNIEFFFSNVEKTFEPKITASATLQID